jgi:hypothetical protein
VTGSLSSLTRRYLRIVRRHLAPLIVRLRKDQREA